jgi:hypothetical protein
MGDRGGYGDDLKTDAASRASQLLLHMSTDGGSTASLPPPTRADHLLLFSNCLALAASLPLTLFSYYSSWLALLSVFVSILFSYTYLQFHSHTQHSDLMFSPDL